MNVKKGDQVVIISGADKGKKAKIVAVLNKQNKVLLEGEGLRVNKRHVKPSNELPDGGIVDKAVKYDASNVMLVVGKDKEQKRTRVNYKVVTEGKGAKAVTRKVRVAKKTQEQID